MTGRLERAQNTQIFSIRMRNWTWFFLLIKSPYLLRINCVGVYFFVFSSSSSNKSSKAEQLGRECSWLLVALPRPIHRRTHRCRNRRARPSRWRPSPSASTTTSRRAADCIDCVHQTSVRVFFSVFTCERHYRIQLREHAVRNTFGSSLGYMNGWVVLTSSTSMKGPGPSGNISSTATGFMVAWLKSWVDKFGGQEAAISMKQNVGNGYEFEEVAK